MRHARLVSRLPAAVSGPMLLAAWVALPTQSLSAQDREAGARVSGFETLASPEGGIRIQHGTSGVVCLDEEGPANVCEPALEIEVRGEEVCDWSPEIQYPCTWYGYELDYDGAEPGASIVCDVLRSDPTTFGPATEEVTGERTARYTEVLEAGHGHLFHPSYNTYAPVEEAVVVRETHRCSHQGEPLFQVRYTLLFEPER